MKVTCPSCGHVFTVQARAPLGSGTLKGRRLRRLGPNKVNVLRILSDAIPRQLTVRDVQRALYAQHIKRWRRGDKTEATGEWNYHHVQVELSLLVGAGKVQMSSDSKETFESAYQSEQRFTAKPVPLYWLSFIPHEITEKEKAETPTP